MKLIRTTGSGRVRYYQLDFKIKNIKGGFMPVRKLDGRAGHAMDRRKDTQI
jgi:hypothetical protein